MPTLTRTLLFGLFMAAALPGWGGSLIVETPLGKLQGSAVGERGEQVRVFRGVPYALPPVGSLRWRPPQPVGAWGYVRSATGYSPACPQAVLGERGGTEVWPMPLTSEDCLYLNVWTNASAGDKQPVMVWIHGGGQVAGSGEIDAAALARKGAVVVSINYRLGPLGYFAHPELSEESPHGASGNYGLLDQIQSLAWVRDNIAAFGGDADRVTVFGQSGGATSVHQLVTSPLARGLFHRAIAQSGTPFYPFYSLKAPAMGQPSAESIGRDFGAGLGAPTLRALRDIPATDIIEAWQDSGIRLLLVVDGWSIPDQPHAIFSRGEQSDVPVLVGFNANEGSYMGEYGLVPSVPATREDYIARVRERFGELADDYLAAYPADNVEDAVFAATRDGMYGWGMHSWAKLTNKVSSDAYLYYFAHEPPGADRTSGFPPGNQQRRVGVFHGGELNFVFHNVESAPDFAGGSAAEQQRHRQLADIVSDYWMGFAATGKPQALGRPQWLAHDDQSRHYMQFEGGEALPSRDLHPRQWSIYDRINAIRRERGVFWGHPDNGINISLPESENIDDSPRHKVSHDVAGQPAQ